MKKICFDLDGVICKTPSNKYNLAKPNKLTINFINKLYDKGIYILIYTSRFMGRNDDNEKKAHKQGYKFTFNQLKKWKLKFHKLKMGKPSYDIIIDDKCVTYFDNWVKILRKNLKKNNYTNL